MTRHLKLARAKTKWEWAGCALLVGFVVGLLAAPVAGAFKAPPEAKPFGIAKFTMQTTETVPITASHDSVSALAGFETVAYPFDVAGGHPEALTTTLEVSNERFILKEEGVEVSLPTRDPKDIVTDLPAGLLGNPQAMPRCPIAQVLSHFEPCPDDTQVGYAVLHLYGYKEFLGPIVNLTPEKGQSAEFGLENEANITYVLTAHVIHTPRGTAGCAAVGGCYGLNVVSNETPLTELDRAELTFWGVPADPIHDAQRGLFCVLERKVSKNGTSNCSGGGQPAGVSPVPFLTMPADCAAGPPVARALVDSWEEPGSYREASTTLPGMTGCNLLQFSPELEVSPDTLTADEPVGLGVNLNVPQVLQPGAPETPQLRNTVLTLPEGLSISPGIVDGVQACNESGPEGINFEGPESEEIGLNGEPQLAPGHCPDASIVGTAKAFTPLLGEPIEGHVYLARPGCGGAGQAPCTEQDALDGNLYKLYLELGGHGALADTGVNLKVAFDTEANPATGQLTTVVANTPQLPFSKLEVHLNGGPRAPLDNPAVCGPAVSTSDLTPWSAPGTTPEGLLMTGTPDATPSSFYEVTGCAGAPGLSPGFVTGTVTPQAGQFSAFTMDLSRQDREQFVKGIQIHTPPGLLGMLSSVPLCGEPQADAGTCPESSKIGSTRVASGAGSHPFEIEGSVYLTGPYRGAPFGLSIVTHAIAGPFNLGVVTVRARIAVDPVNSTLTITTDETGPYAIPQILDGVPLRLKRVTVNIDRPDFMFNPTSCGAPGSSGAQQVTAKVSGSQNAVASVQSQFAVGGCKSLEFKPGFAVSTNGHTSKQNGASLDAKVTYPPFKAGSEANIAYVKVELPKQLPSRLTTLQKACTAAQFESNPAGCPPASVIGIVRASTPLLPVGLEGPAYFVSHGGEAFPSLVIVLQGDGVRVDLTAATFISKAGITSSTFKTVPDVPVSSFELYLPQGKFSALAANTSLCNLTTTKTIKRKVTQHIHGRTVQKTITSHTTTSAALSMPTEFIAQNGAALKQNTQIAVTGCTATTAKAKPKAKHRRKAKKAAVQSTDGGIRR